VPELRDKNIPVSVRRVPPTEAFMRGICFFGGPLASQEINIRGYDLLDFVQGYQLLVMEYKYADGSTQIKYVWDRYKGVSLAQGTYKYITDPFQRILDEFKKKYPDKVVYAPRPWQKGWMFTIDPSREGGYLFSLYLRDGKAEKAEQLAKEKGYPLTRRDFAYITHLYHYGNNQVFYGGLGEYNIKEHPYFNMYFEDYLVNYPRKYPTDHTRFAYYCKDYSKIPQLYREPMLRLADLGIITPDQSALYIGVYYFNPAKMLTRADAVQMIARVFDKGKRDVLDEVNVKLLAYWIPEVNVGTGKYMIFELEKKKYRQLESKADEWGEENIASPQATFRIEEPKSMRFVIMAKSVTPNKYVSEKGYGSLSLANVGYSIGSYNLAQLRFNGQSIILYDEFAAPKIMVCDPLVSLYDYPKTKLLNYVAPAYREELQKDLNTYTFKKIKSVSKSGTIIRQYGDIFITFNSRNSFGCDVVEYKLYTVLPSYFSETNKKDKGYYVFLTPAKPNSKYIQ